MKLDKSKILFIHIPKTGGNSVSELLLQNQDNPYLPLEMHFRIQDYWKWYPETRNYWSFSFARNPWDATVSLFSSLQGHREDVVPRDFNEFLFDMDRDRFKKHLKDLNWDLGLYNLLEFGQDLWVNREIDFIGKLENISNDIKILNSKGNFDLSKLRVANRSRRKFKSYRDYYNKESIEYVRKRNKKTITWLDYKF